MKKFFLAIITLFLSLPSFAEVWTIAIDPGHGGKDPGAIGRNLKIYEKNVTLSIAKELKILLDKDPNFRGVLTRKGDYFISVPDRSEIARKNKANYLISIHADSSATPNFRGASVWVLSNRRANSEMGQWLEDHEKQSELLGGAGSVLAGQNEKYLDQTVLDLQFGHSQRVGYELGRSILRNFSKITQLSRSAPQHASLGVLRSPDIPSVLVETGFLSNAEEEAKLSTAAYRRRVAYIIYQGLVDYHRRNAKADMLPKIAKSATEDKNESESAVKDSGIRHKVKSGESLDTLSKKYAVKISDIMQLNQLKRKSLKIGQSIKIPDNGKNKNNKSAEKTPNTVKDSGIRHKVKSGESLDSLAKKYAVSINDIVQLNQLKRKSLKVGERIKIPSGTKSAVKNTDNLKKDAIGELIDKKTAKDKNSKKETSVKTEEVPKYHIIQKDQTIYAVSREYGIPVNRILKLNPQLKNGKALAGQRIKLRE